MTKKRIWLAAVAVAWCLAATESRAQAAQSSQQDPAKVITRSIEVKSADPYSIKTTLDPIAKANGTVITYDSRNKVLILAGDSDRINEMEGLIRRLDVAPPVTRGIELTVYLLFASDVAGSAENLPQQIDPALKQLRATFNYKSYRLLDTAFLRNRIGESGSTNGVISGPTISVPNSETKPESLGLVTQTYTLSYNASYLSHDEKGDVIHLNNVNLKTPSAGIQTNLDLRPGQLVVVGKTAFARSDSALIAIVTAKIVD
ncbi:MAG: hypothetical protein LAP85_11660 [Acidobacteriia bacterium]|nr:hypothetical protein [Terriglobia bacterium]